MNEHSSPISSQLKQDWRDYLLGKVVTYLEQNKENILSEFQIKNGKNPDVASNEKTFDQAIGTPRARARSFAHYELIKCRTDR